VPDSAELNTIGGSPVTCPEHIYVVRTMERLVKDQVDGFSRLESRIETLHTLQGQRIEALATAQAVATAEMRGLKERLEGRIDGVQGAVEDITEVGIKVPTKKGDLRETEDGGITRRVPRWAIGVGAGIVLAIALIGYFVGYWASTGSSAQASSAVHQLIQPAAAQAAQEMTGDSPQTAAIGRGGEDQ
jgi:hypothetical protein